MAAKDFGTIETDYAFFMAHATEAANDLAQYAHVLADFAAGRQSIHLLDLGCGTGDFSQQFLTRMAWPADKLRLTLIEPVRDQRQQAAGRLTSFSTHAIDSADQLPLPSQFDLILANHSLYYVDDLAATLRALFASVAPEGCLLLAIAGWDNMLMQLWQYGFALLDQPVPYYAADDVALLLSQYSCSVHTSRVPYQLRFSDTTDNRLRILRFLFADHLQRLPLDAMLARFDPFARDGQIDIHTHSQHFLVTPATP